MFEARFQGVRHEIRAVRTLSVNVSGFVILATVAFAQARAAVLHLDPAWRYHAPTLRVTALRDQTAVDRLWQQTGGSPLVETIPADANHVLVTFLYRGVRGTKNVTLSAQLSTNRQEPALTRLLNTDLWYKTYWMRKDLRLSYGFVPDPVPPGPAADRRTLELPAAAPQPWNAAGPGVPAGKVVEEQIDSQILQTRRRAWIYFPPGYDPQRTRPYPVAIIFDGPEYNATDRIPGPTIVDNLIAARKVEPMMLVLVGQLPQPGRNLELGNNAPFADYVATELLPHVRSKFRVTSEADQTALCGSSAGGLGATYVAYRHPEEFGNVLSQSGAFWPGKTRDDPQHEWVIRQYESSPKRPIRFVLQAGVLEIVNTPLNGPPILSSNRHLRDVLQAKGYEVYYSETAGGHEPLNWRGGFAEGLIQLFGR